MTFLGDEIRKGISIIIEVCIISLNAHFSHQKPQHKMLRVVKVGALEAVELSSPTQRRYRVLSQCDEDRLNRQTD